MALVPTFDKSSNLTVQLSKDDIQINAFVFSEKKVIQENMDLKLDSHHKYSITVIGTGKIGIIGITF